MIFKLSKNVIDDIDDDDDDVVVIPIPFFFTCHVKDHVPPIKNPLVLPTPSYEGPPYFLAHPFSTNQLAVSIVSVGCHCIPPTFILSSS
jgi:hypothetical protein